ncbi:MAG: ribonuclease J, partial [Ignavibacteriae bacterium]|nr:ribonuclease J [Ignavibacteriota bacterium]
MYRNKRIFGNNTSKLKIIPIAGLEFIGANCTAFEFDNDIVVIDAGLGFPTQEMYGVDFVIPNNKYFIQNKNKIKGLVITHGHLDHIGAIPYLIEDLGFTTIYASQFAKELILQKFKYDKPDLLGKITIKTINKESKLSLGNFKLEFFGVNHSIPESMGVFINSPVGTVVHTGDFKFDNAPINEPIAEYAKIAQIGSKGVLCLLSDSTNSYKEGHCLSESEISKKLDTVIGEVQGRVVIATFASMVNRVLELLKIAQKYNRKVFISGSSMKTAISTAIKIGYAKFPKELFISGQDINKLPANKVMILATGSQGEPLAALGRMARNEHKDVKVIPGDTVILSASVIPGNGAVIQKLIDMLSKLGANVYHNEIMNLHTTGHGHKEEQKLMINLVQPKFFMPVHGFRSFLSAHGQTAQQVGIKTENIIIAGDGDVIEFDSNSWKKAGKITAKPLNVSGSVVGDVGNIILEDRQQLANYGVVVYTLFMDKNTKALIKEPSITSRGFIFVKTSKELITEA